MKFSTAFWRLKLERENEKMGQCDKGKRRKGDKERWKDGLKISIMPVICNPQSAIRNPQSAIHNLKSAI